MIRPSRALSNLDMRISSAHVHRPVRLHITTTPTTTTICRQIPSHARRLQRNASTSSPDKSHSSVNPQRPVAQTLPATPKSIPGPTWLWLEPIYEPFRRYGRMQQRRPYWTQFFSSIVIYFVGDCVAQGISSDSSVAVEQSASANDNEAVQGSPAADEVEDRGWLQAWFMDRDWWRTGRALVIGGAAAVPGYKWFLWLSNSFNYSSKIFSLTVKVTVNQILFTPLFNTYFFGMQSLLSGLSLSETVTRIQHTVPTSVLNSCKLWPAVTAFSFTYVPLQYRSIFGGVIAIGWQTYLSLLNEKAKKSELEVGPDNETIDPERGTAQTSRQRSIEKDLRNGEKCPA